jgi:hypothetical protein
LGVAAGGDAGPVVAVPCVPGDDQGAGEQGERDGALDGAAGAIAGFACAGDVAGVGEGLLARSCGHARARPAPSSMNTSDVPLPGNVGRDCYDRTQDREIFLT